MNSDTVRHGNIIHDDADRASMNDHDQRVLLGRVSRGERIDDVRERLVLLLVAAHGAFECELLLQRANLAAVRFNQIGCEHREKTGNLCARV